LLRTGHHHLAQGSYRPAVTAYQAVLRINPRHAIALNFLGAALGALGQYSEAESYFRQAIEIDPNYPEAHCNLGAALRAQAQLEQAQVALRRALQLRPKYPDALTHLGLILLLLGRTAEAKPILEQLSRLVPRDTTVLLGLGQQARTEGRFEEAEATFKRVLEIDRNCSDALAGLVSVRKQTAADDSWLRRAEQLLSGPLTPLAEVALRFAVGKYYDDVGEFARAFANYRRGNEILKASVTPYNRKAHAHFVDDLTRVYRRGRPKMRDLPNQPATSLTPVLVVGMPRSGTSLVEQIIASHPAARAAGELTFWTAVVHEHEAAVRRAPPEEPLRAELAGAYLQTLMRAGEDVRCIVDKAPVNADYLGIIHSVLPQARFIYLRRNPIDTCLSCYFQQFSAALKFTMDLTDLADYYRQHQRLMTHWRAVLPPQTLLDVPYAELVADPPTWTRRILEFIGLEWHERCLQFYNTRRTVATASAWQVRQKIYTSSVERWRHYQEFIGPLLALRDSVA
jgi:tetratricopeptide (TPR) repeat protein